MMKRYDEAISHRLKPVPPWIWGRTDFGLCSFRPC